MIKINPNIPVMVSKKVLDRVNNLNTKYSNLSVYRLPYKNDFQSQEIFSKRYEELYSVLTDKLTPQEFNNPFLIIEYFNDIKTFESFGENSNIVTKLAIQAVKKEFNLSDDEVLFDVEIVNSLDGCQPSEDGDFEIHEPEDRPQDIESDLLRRYLVNAIVTGSGMRGMNIFNVFSDRIDKLDSNIVEIYRKASILNEFMLFGSPDEIVCKAIEDGGAGSFMRIEFENDTPKIVIRAINLVSLCHELYKSVVYITSMYSLDDDKEKAKLIMNYCDVVENEPMEFRFGPYFWSNIHSLIPIEDYDIKKNILIKIFSLELHDFLEFMRDVCHYPTTQKARLTVEYFIQDIRKEIMEYELEKDFDIDDIDLSELGFK
jgi:hypothetical protein